MKKWLTVSATSLENGKVEEEIKVRIEELDKRIEVYEKRFKDIKVYFTSIISVITLIFSVLIIALNWNFNSEKTALREFQQDIRTTIGKSDPPPSLVLLGTNNELLENQDIIGELIEDKNKNIHMRFKYSIKNESISSSGPLYFKIYCCEPIIFKAMSTDEPRYHYETYITPKYIEPSEIPGNYTSNYAITSQLYNNIELQLNMKYPLLLRVNYGKGKIVKANFNIIFINKMRLLRNTSQNLFKTGPDYAGQMS